MRRFRSRPHLARRRCPPRGRCSRRRSAPGTPNSRLPCAPQATRSRPPGEGAWPGSRGHLRDRTRRHRCVRRPRHGPDAGTAWEVRYARARPASSGRDRGRIEGRRTRVWPTREQRSSRVDGPRSLDRGQRADARNSGPAKPTQKSRLKAVGSSGTLRWEADTLPTQSLPLGRARSQTSTVRRASSGDRAATRTISGDGR